MYHARFCWGCDARGCYLRTAVANVDEHHHQRATTAFRGQPALKNAIRQGHRGSFVDHLKPLRHIRQDICKALHYSGSCSPPFQRLRPSFALTIPPARFFHRYTLRTVTVLVTSTPTAFVEGIFSHLHNVRRSGKKKRGEGGVRVITTHSSQIFPVAFLDGQITYFLEGRGERRRTFHTKISSHLS